MRVTPITPAQIDAIAAAWDLLRACEEDCSLDDIERGVQSDDADDEPVGHSVPEGKAQSVPTAMTFGHMRRLRKALVALTTGGA